MKSPTASRPSIIETPQLMEDWGTGSGGSTWVVTVFNNDHNTAEEVIHILMVATQCDSEEALMETWEIHHLGKSVVHHGVQEECETVATVIAQIGIEVRVSEE